MPDNTSKQVSLSDYKGKYVGLYFWPADFTFVCASETLAFHAQLNEFTDLLLGRNVEEVIRVLDTVKTTDENAGQVCAANWKKGKPLMTASTEGVADYLVKYT